MFHTLGAIKNRLPVGDAESGVRLEAEKDLAARSHLIISATEAEKEELVRLYGAIDKHIKVVPCGVNMSLFEPLDRLEARQALGFGEGKIILSVGRIEALKGMDNLVRAMGLLNPPGAARLVVIGGDEHSRSEVSRLKKMAQEAGLPNSIEFPGTVEQSRLPLYYSAADVSVVASYYESFCLVILESLACGTPVVSTPVGVGPAVIRDGKNGYLVADNWPSKLAAGLDAVLGGGEMDRPAIRKTAARYDWKSIAKQVELEYLGLLNSPIPAAETTP
jgi:D-inositol-3-phosphate glycosyltransferase